MRVMLRGGPSDGLVATVSGRRPAVILDIPMRPTVFDIVMGELVWNELSAWYERRPAPEVEEEK